ncbi:MAG: tetratricopeptide repeat protein [Thermonemataceae bacterium]|nr:tetratricopeptide repeat protein [Thermonemataceae bacterium]
MLNKIVYPVLFHSLFFISFLSFGQKNRIDSLQRALKINSGEKEIRTLVALSEEWLSYEQENSFKYAFIALQKAQTLNFKEGELAAKNMLGNAYLLRAEIGDIKEAYKAYQYVLDATEKSKKENEERERAKAMSGLANIHYQWGEYKEATSMNLASLKIREKYKDIQGEARCYNTSGLIYDALNDYKSAAIAYTKSLNLYEKIQKKHEIAGVLNNLAASLKLDIETSQQGNLPIDYSQVLDYYNRSLKISEEIGDKLGISRTLNNLGVLYQSQKDTDKALKFYEKSLEVTLSTESKQGLASTYNNIAKIYRENDQWKEALGYYEKALQTADDAESKFELYNTLKERSSLYAEQNLFQEAYSDLLAANVLKNQLDEIENLSMVNSLNSRYELEKAKKETALLRYQNQIKEQEQQIWWGFAGFIFVITALVAVFWYRQSQLRKNTI